MGTDFERQAMQMNAKLARAMAHIEHVCQIIKLERSRDVLLRREYCQDHGCMRIVIAETRVPPLLLAIVSGEALNQLRSVLDHIAFALVKTVNPSVKDNAPKFPIFDRPTEFDERHCNYLPGLPEDLLSIFRDLQPLNAENPSLHPLSLLRELNNTDKHRLLLLLDVAVLLEKVTFKKGTDVSLVTGPGRSIVEEGTELLRVYTLNPDIHLDVSAKLRVSILEGDLSFDHSIEGVLKLIYDEVDHVLDKLLPELQCQLTLAESRG